jgi:hypothetical protein
MHDQDWRLPRFWRIFFTIAVALFIISVLGFAWVWTVDGAKVEPYFNQYQR